jgi:hypothetical protein
MSSPRHREEKKPRGWCAATTSPLTLLELGKQHLLLVHRSGVKSHTDTASSAVSNTGDASPRTPRQDAGGKSEVNTQQQDAPTPKAEQKTTAKDKGKEEESDNAVGTGEAGAEAEAAETSVPTAKKENGAALSIATKNAVRSQDTNAPCEMQTIRYTVLAYPSGEVVAEFSCQSEGKCVGCACSLLLDYSCGVVWYVVAL